MTQVSSGGGTHSPAPMNSPTGVTATLSTGEARRSTGVAVAQLPKEACDLFKQLVECINLQAEAIHKLNAHVAVLRRTPHWTQTMTRDVTTDVHREVAGAWAEASDQAEGFKLLEGVLNSEKRKVSRVITEVALTPRERKEENAAFNNDMNTGGESGKFAGEDNEKEGDDQVASDEGAFEQDVKGELKVQAMPKPMRSVNVEKAKTARVKSRPRPTEKEQLLGFDDRSIDLGVFVSPNDMPSWSYRPSKGADVAGQPLSAEQNNVAATEAASEIIKTYKQRYQHLHSAIEKEMRRELNAMAAHRGVDIQAIIPEAQADIIGHRAELVGSDGRVYISREMDGGGSKDSQTGPEGLIQVIQPVAPPKHHYYKKPSPRADAEGGTVNLTTNGTLVADEEDQQDAFPNSQLYSVGAKPGGEKLDMLLQEQSQDEPPEVFLSKAVQNVHKKENAVITVNDPVMTKPLSKKMGVGVSSPGNDGTVFVNFVTAVSDDLKLTGPRNLPQVQAPPNCNRPRRTPRTVAGHTRLVPLGGAHRPTGFGTSSPGRSYAGKPVHTPRADPAQMQMQEPPQNPGKTLSHDTNRGIASSHNSDRGSTAPSSAAPVRQPSTGPSMVRQNTSLKASHQNLLERSLLE